MRRVIYITLLVLGIAALCLWAYGYLYVMGLACAFGSPNTTSCSVKLPWELHGEDLTLLVITPLIIVSLIFGVAWLAKPPKG